MIEYKASAVKEDFSNETRGVHSAGEKLSLTQLWEIISRTKRLPDGLDVNALYAGVRHKLRDPEREVRQHALRVLVDLIPVTQPQTLDDHMRDVLPELVSNLGNSAPAMRKNAIDSLRKYLQHSRDYDRLVVDLISSTEDDHIIAAIPYLIASETKDGTMATILNQLWKDVKNPYVNKEVAAKSLATIGYSLGVDKFKAFIGATKYNDLQRICDNFGIVQHCPETYRSNDLWNKADDRVILETEITLRTGPAITMKIHEECGTNSALHFLDDFGRNSSPMLGVINILEEESNNDFDETVKRTPRKVRFGGESVKLRTPESDDSVNEGGGGVISITVTDAVSIETKRSLIPVRISSLPTTPKKVMYDDVVKRMHTSTPDLTSRSRFSKIPMKTNSNLTDKFRLSTNNEITKKQLTSPKQRKPTELRTNKESGANTAIQVNKRSRLSPSRTNHNEIEVFHNLTRSPVRKSEPPLKENENNNKHNDIDIEKCASPSHNSQNQEWQVVVHEPAQNPESSKSDIGKASDAIPSEPVGDQKGVEERKTNQKHEDKEELAYDSFQVFDNGTTEAKVEDSSVTKTENGFHFLEDNNNSFLVCPEISQDNLAVSNDRNLNDSSGLWVSGEDSFQHSLPVLYSKSEMALAHLIEGWRTEELEQCLWRLVPDICRARAPSGINMALMIMRRCSPRKFQDELLTRCFAHQLREGALQVLMAIARFLPSTEIEISRITRFAAASLKDRRKRVRQAALETLASVASLGSNAQVLEIVEEVTSFAPDHRYLMNVVRTRLSRRQLPTIEDNGTIRYSSPKDQTEYEWLLGEKIYSDSSPSSASSSHSINYWTRNSRHVKDDRSEVFSNRDENANSNQPVWAVDPTVFHRNGYAKDNNKSSATVLQPVYILRSDPTGQQPPHRYGSYERGRSFSPPKHRRGAAESASPRGLAPAPIRAAHLEGFRKSFSSEQLQAARGRSRAREGCDRSSTSSTGSSTKSGVWQKEMKSGIPIPISSDTKLRFRSSNATTNNASVGPVVARIRNLESPRDDRLSPRDPKRVLDEKQAHHFPLSSGSESSGYFTPPYGTNEEAFVKLEDVPGSIFHSVEGEEVTESDTNNNSQEYVNSCEDEVDEAGKAPQGYSKPNTPDCLTIENLSTGNPNEEETLRIPALTSKEDLTGSISPPSFVLNFPGPNTPSLSGKSSPRVENRRKSNSVVDLQNFLPEIPKRKNSAPVMKDDVSISRQYLTTTVADIPSPDKISIKSSEHKSDFEETEAPDKPAATSTRKLSKRLSRTSSRKSIRSTPRSVRGPTPVTARIDPKEDLQLALAQLSNPEWEVTVQGLQGVARIARQHPEVVEARMHNVCVHLGRHIKNLRSQVARAACVTATEMFGSCRKGLEVELEEVAGPLLHRTADTNKFLRADANAALDLMCLQLPPTRVISILIARGCSHQNGVVRSTGIRLLADLAKRLGPDRIIHLHKECRDKVFLAGAKSLVDGSLEARHHGKSLFSHLIGHQLFQRCLLEAVPQSTLRHVAKTLNSIKPVEANEC